MLQLSLFPDRLQRQESKRVTLAQRQTHAASKQHNTQEN